MDTIDVIVGIAVLVIGPGSGVFVGTRASFAELRADNKRAAVVLAEIRDELKTLNGRVSRSEDHIEDLEDREGARHPLQRPGDSR